LLLGGLAVVLIVVSVGIILFVQRLQADPIALSSANNGLAFISDRDGSWDLFYLDQDETLTNLTDGGPGEQDYFASWSLNGEAINFLSNRTGQMGPAQVRPGGEVRTLNPLQALTEMVSDEMFDWDPMWSPTGERLVYSSLANGFAVNLDLYALVAETGERTRLTQDGLGGPNDWFVAWAPAGDRIAYNSDRDGDENIYLMTLADQSITRLTDAQADDIHAAWSLDGETILFVSERENTFAGGTLDLYLMSPDGGDQRPFGEGDVFTGDPVYAANGEQIAYMSNEEGFWNIYIMDADGENARRVTPNDANYLFPAWRPIPAPEATDGDE